MVRAVWLATIPYKVVAGRRNAPDLQPPPTATPVGPCQGLRHDLTRRASHAFGGVLSYKVDPATADGSYGKGSAIYVSQAGSLDFEARRSRRD